MGEQLTEREERIANEGFMVGRVYASMGETESPAHIHRKLMEKCARVAGPRRAAASPLPPLPDATGVLDAWKAEMQTLCASYGVSIPTVRVIAQLAKIDSLTEQPTEQREPCEGCNGSGKFYDASAMTRNQCPECHGTGKQPTEQGG